MLCIANASLAGRPVDMGSWSTENFESYAQYLDKMPLANYALRHLKYHIDGSEKDVNVQNSINQFIGELIRSPAIYLLHTWIKSYSNKVFLSNKQVVAANETKCKILQVATWNGFCNATEILLAVGANVNTKDHLERTPLHRGTEGGHEAVVSLLMLEGKADVNAKDQFKRTALHLAAEMGYESIARLLVLEGKADTNITDEFGWTALHWAATKGHEAIAKLLVVEGKAHADAKSRRGETALRLATNRGHKAVMKLLAVSYAG